MPELKFLIIYLCQISRNVFQKSFQLYFITFEINS